MSLRSSSKPYINCPLRVELGSLPTSMPEGKCWWGFNNFCMTTKSHFKLDCRILYDSILTQSGVSSNNTSTFEVGYTLQSLPGAWRIPKWESVKRASAIFVPRSRTLNFVFPSIEEDVQINALNIFNRLIYTASYVTVPHTLIFFMQNSKMTIFSLTNVELNLLFFNENIV